MKVFPTLLDGIRSELINQGKNEFYVEGEYVGNNKDYQLKLINFLRKPLLTDF